MMLFETHLSDGKEGDKMSPQFEQVSRRVARKQFLLWYKICRDNFPSTVSSKTKGPNSLPLFSELGSVELSTE